MTDRLDRIEAGIDDLLGAAAANEAKLAATDERINKLLEVAEENQQHFEVLRAEAQNSRDEYRALFNDSVAQMERDRLEAARRFDAQQEIIQRLLLGLLDRAKF
ncbi:MAG: hypothetical protein AAFY72_06945 [Cyanobacteria bacterium J06649_4]